MWNIPQLGVDTSHKIFVSVKNESTVTMTVGHGVYWNYSPTTGAAVGNGYGVTFSPIATTNGLNPALLCGVVGRDNIGPNEYGMVQKFGEHPAVWISAGASALPYISQVATISTWTAAQFTDLILRPCAGIFTAAGSGAVANAGYFGFVRCIPIITTQVATTASNIAHAWPGGYLVPIGNVATTITAATYTTGTTLKAFIHCLD
jgi:hypothetical protein